MQQIEFLLEPGCMAILAQFCQHCTGSHIKRIHFKISLINYKGQRPHLHCTGCDRWTCKQEKKHMDSDILRSVSGLVYVETNLIWIGYVHLRLLCKRIDWIFPFQCESYIIEKICSFWKHFCFMLAYVDLVSSCLPVSLIKFTCYSFRWLV